MKNAIHKFFRYIRLLGWIIILMNFYLNNINEID